MNWKNESREKLQKQKQQHQCLRKWNLISKPRPYLPLPEGLKFSPQPPPFSHQKHTRTFPTQVSITSHIVARTSQAPVFPLRKSRFLFRFIHSSLLFSSPRQWQHPLSLSLSRDFLTFIRLLVAPAPTSSYYSGAGLYCVLCFLFCFQDTFYAASSVEPWNMLQFNLQLFTHLPEAFGRPQSGKVGRCCAQVESEKNLVLRAGACIIVLVLRTYT